MTSTNDLDAMSYGVADLLPAAPEPDRTETISLSELSDQMYDTGLGPVAEFQGIGYALGVYLLQTGPGRYSCAVAPTHVGGPPRAMATAEVRFFDFEGWRGEPVAYAKAALWALRQTALDAERESA